MPFTACAIPTRRPDMARGKAAGSRTWRSTVARPALKARAISTRRTSTPRTAGAVVAATMGSA